jgi:hypothetical protein
MTEIHRWVLIGDPSLERFQLIQRILIDEFRADAIRTANYDEFISRLKERTWDLLLIAEDLPRSPTINNVLLFEHFTHLNIETPGVNKGIILSVGAPRELERVRPAPTRIHVPSANPSPAEREKIVTEIGTLLSLASRLPDLIPIDSASLLEQIRSLSESRNLEEGQRLLKHLIRGLFPCEKVEIARIGQGMSGAKVFRVRPQGGKSQEFILKLGEASELWKILLEVDRHAEARPTLGVEDYLVHSPRLVDADAPAEIQGQPQRQLAQCKNWYAIGYDFLGGEKFGKLIDLETVITASAVKLEERTAGTDFSISASDSSAIALRRRQFLETTLDWLCRSWYMNSKYCRRESHQVWNTTDAVDKYPSMPPYQLGGKNKGFILSFLDSSLATMGEHFFSDWATLCKRVWDLVEKTGLPTGIHFLDRELPFILSPAHGDLNGTNVMLWLDQSCHPFLIDFPFFQKQGHALQDFARLEVEIKLSLLDRQADACAGPLPAGDLTFSQLPLWKELEDHLLADDWNQPKDKWTADGIKENVELSLLLIQSLRSRAVSVQNQIAGADNGRFMDEYKPALLYHTVRAIGYSSLSAFKRLLAVYSAGQIIGD